MQHKFANLNAAIDAGYGLVNRATDKDVSGPNSFGYDFADADGNRTVDVWLDEATNMIGTLGAVRPMYPPTQ